MFTSTEMSAARLAPLAFALCLGCGPEAPPTVTSAWSASGAVMLSLSSGSVSLGQDSLTLTAEDPSGAGLTGLTMRIEISMPDMGHSEGELEIAEVGEGDYLLTTDLDMTGLWVLDGVILGEADDPFLLAVEAW